MSSLEALTGSQFLSHSSMETALKCGEQYRLTRILRVPETKAWYLLGGSAVHEATEFLDRGDTDSPIDAWEQAWKRQLSTIDDGEELRAGGRATKEWPNKENGDWWQVHGLKMVIDYHDWSKARQAEGWQILGVEVAFETMIGDTPVRGFVDRVWSNPDGEVEVHDLKTGSREPASPLQLGVYRHGIQQAMGIDPAIGRFVMNRRVDPSYVPYRNYLGRYSMDLLTAWYSRVQAIIEQDLLVPHVTAMCGSCSVQRYCSAFGGKPPAGDYRTA